MTKRPSPRTQFIVSMLWYQTKKEPKPKCGKSAAGQTCADWQPQTSPGTPHGRSCCQSHDRYTPGRLSSPASRRTHEVGRADFLCLVLCLWSRKIRWKYRDEPRKGDHICHISDLRKLRAHFPNWQLTYDLKRILGGLLRPSKKSSALPGSLIRYADGRELAELTRSVLASRLRDRK
jgi:hypothetical protein